MWGFDGVVLTPRLYNLDIGFVVFMLHLVPFVLMNIFLFKQYKWVTRFSREDLFLLLLIALFGGALGTLAIVKALFLVNFQHLSIVVLLQKLQPIFAIILATVILKEKLSRNFALWTIIALASSYFLTFGLALPHRAENPRLLEAALWAVLAAFSFGSSTVLSKKILQKYSFYTVNFYRFGLTAILMFIYVMMIGKFNEFSNITTTNWLFFLIIALTTGSGALFLYYYGLNKVKAMVSTICELFFPISAIIFDYLINGQVLTPVQWISAAVMIFAILKISLNKKLGR
jgi:drug/metabolite transporter (DMT)-like permease